MDRKEFIHKCIPGCLGLLFLQSTLSSCVTQKSVNATIVNDYLALPLKSFETVKNDQTTYLNAVIVRNALLQHPICVFRNGVDNYVAVLMKCTHQGAALKVFGDTLQCAAHGSEFDSNGFATNGPATDRLRTFETNIETDTLKIYLK